MALILTNLIAILGIIVALYLICKTYKWLWSSLIYLKSFISYKNDQLLIYISLTLAVAFIIIICIFGFIFSLLTLMQLNDNQIIFQRTGEPVKWHQIDIFIYFSAVTYFSLGYGDYIPLGSEMQLAVMFASLIGYINSGLIIAYVFDIFKRKQ